VCDFTVCAIVLRPMNGWFEVLCPLHRRLRCSCWCMAREHPPILLVEQRTKLLEPCGRQLLKRVLVSIIASCFRDPPSQRTMLCPFSYKGIGFFFCSGISCDSE
jgi:hypothetical protein